MKVADIAMHLLEAIEAGEQAFYDRQPGIDLVAD